MQLLSRVYLGLLALCTILSTIALVSAETFIVVDVDGSIEDYAAITTILQHPDYSGRLRLVTVSGATWGYSSTVVRNVCRFVSLARASSTVKVAQGEPASDRDAYRVQTHLGGCADVEGFPATPRDAEARGMSYSRADVTSAYGQTYALPHIKTTEATCDYTIHSASAHFVTLLRQTDADRDKIVYLQLGSATNLAAVAEAVQAQGSPSLLARFYAVVEAHVFETGYSGGADNTSMADIFSPYNAYRLTVRLYPPVFYNPGVTFNLQSWSQFGTIADTAGSSAAVSWLYRAWAEKKALLDKNSEGDIVAFFKERGPASSLIVLCALDDTIKSLCQSYRRPVASLQMVSVVEPTPASEAESVLSITGNNVTSPFYYLVTTANEETSGATQSYVYSVPAAEKVGSSSTALVDVFWDRWFAVLRL